MDLTSTSSPRSRVTSSTSQGDTSAGFGFLFRPTLARAKKAQECITSALYKSNSNDKSNELREHIQDTVVGHERRNAGNCGTNGFSIHLIERVEAVAIVRVLAVEAVVLLIRSSRSAAENASDSARSTCSTDLSFELNSGTGD